LNVVKIERLGTSNLGLFAIYTTQISFPLFHLFLSCVSFLVAARAQANASDKREKSDYVWLIMLSVLMIAKLHFSICLQTFKQKDAAPILCYTQVNGNSDRGSNIHNLFVNGIPSLVKQSSYDLY